MYTLLTNKYLAFELVPLLLTIARWRRINLMCERYELMDLMFYLIVADDVRADQCDVS